MLSGQMSVSLATLCLLVTFLSLFSNTESRTMDSLGLEGLRSSTSLITGAKDKRRLFDSSCKGIYDRELFSQLERVCEDCYNLYRKPHVATECRQDCFNNDMFSSCAASLYMPIDEILNNVLKIAIGSKI